MVRGAGGTGGLSDPVPLFGGGDMRVRTLLDALLTVINERGQGMGTGTILGTITLLEMAFVAQEREKL
jgi:hypothetical protein